MIKVIKHREPDYQVKCDCGAILQFNKDDISTQTHYDWDFSVTYYKITCPECNNKIQLQKPFTQYEVIKERG